MHSPGCESPRLHREGTPAVCPLSRRQLLLRDGAVLPALHSPWPSSGAMLSLLCAVGAGLLLPAESLRWTGVQTTRPGTGQRGVTWAAQTPRLGPWATPPFRYARLPIQVLLSRQFPQAAWSGFLPGQWEAWAGRTERPRIFRSNLPNNGLLSACQSEPRGPAVGRPGPSPAKTGGPFAFPPSVHSLAFPFCGTNYVPLYRSSPFFPTGAPEPLANKGEGAVSTAHSRTETHQQGALPQIRGWKSARWKGRRPGPGPRCASPRMARLIAGVPSLPRLLFFTSRRASASPQAAADRRGVAGRGGLELFDRQAGAAPKLP